MWLSLKRKYLHLKILPQWRLSIELPVQQSGWSSQHDLISSCGISAWIVHLTTLSCGVHGENQDFPLILSPALHFHHKHFNVLQTDRDSAVHVCLLFCLWEEGKHMQIWNTTWLRNLEGNLTIGEANLSMKNIIWTRHYPSLKLRWLLSRKLCIAALSTQFDAHRFSIKTTSRTQWGLKRKPISVCRVLRNSGKISVCHGSHEPREHVSFVYVTDEWRMMASLQTQMERQTVFCFDVFLCVFFFAILEKNNNIISGWVMKPLHVNLGDSLFYDNHIITNHHTNHIHQAR